MQRIEEITAKALEKIDKIAINWLCWYQRAEQLANGAEPLIKADKNKSKFTDIALMEIVEGKVRLESIS